MSDTATQSGVVSKRAAMMAEIAAQRETQIDREMKDGGTPEGIAVLARPDEAPAAAVKPEGVDQAEWDELSEEARAGVAAAEEERRLAEAAAKPEEKPAAEVKPAKVKIKVDGVEQEVDEEAVRQAGIKALQKESAADKRLEEATRLFREAQAAITAAQSGHVQDPNNNAASLPKGGSGAEVLTDQAFIEAVKKIQYGSETEAAATLKDLISKAAGSGQSEQLTLDRVAEMLDFRDATQWAHGEYKEILGDPMLKTLFLNEERRIRAAGDMRPYREVYKDIGDGLREWLKGKAPSQPAEQPVDTLQSRRERKASVVSIPSAAARLPSAPQPKTPSPSEVIDQMRKARRQA